MQYFRNTDLARIYKVSEKSVRNWIQAARDGKLDLKLHLENDRYSIANTTKNTVLIEQLVQKGKKYKNSRGAKTISPKKAFYQAFTTQQILDIVSDLTIHKEIPLQYGYAKGGAITLEHYEDRLFHEPTPNLLNTTLELLQTTADYLDKVVDAPRVNVVHLGPGNGQAVRPLLQHLLDQNRLERFIAIDISQEVLGILERNTRKWFGKSVKFESHVRDFSFERFGDILLGDATNIVTLFGATLNNFRLPDQILQTTNCSLGLDDVLLYNGFLDTPSTRRYFDFDAEITKPSQRSPRPSRLVPELLGIDESLYVVEEAFSEAKSARSTIIRPKIDLTLRLEIARLPRHIELHKDEPILIWRHTHYSMPKILELFNKNNFDLLQATTSRDRDYVLLVYRIRSGSDDT
jgi:uncharacterized SAM-dependent methyltransferase